MTLPRGLYGMVDAGPGDTLDTLTERARFLADWGAQVIQLRDKRGEASVLRPLAEACVGLVPVLVINDDAALAAALGVWAHLGQDDGPDPAAPFGRSTHTLAQVRAAGAARYIGFGPVFATTTKDTGYTARGLDALAEAVRASAVPVVAIGGITLDNLDAVRATGVHGYAVIGGFWAHRGDPERLRRFR